MQVVVDSLLTNYQQTGKGKQDLLLLHGWGDSAATFRSIEKQLSSKFRLTAVDLPGFGGSQVPPEAWGLHDYSIFLQQFTDKISIKPVAVIAHSNGAAVALKAIAEGHLKPKKLVLLGAAGIRNQQKVKKLGLKVIAKTGKAVTFWLPAQHKKKLQKKLYGAAGSDMLIVPHMQETFKRTVKEDVQKEAAKVTVPTLLIYGENDKATPSAYGEIYQTVMPDARLVVVANAAHFVHHDQPKRVTMEIEEFLK